MRRLVLLCCWALLSCVGVAAASPRAYVTDWTSGTVTEIDTRAQIVLRRISLGLGEQPRHIVAAADGERAYVANSESVAVVDTSTNHVIDTLFPLDCPCSVLSIALTPDDMLLAVAIGGADPADAYDRVLLIDTSTHSLVASIPIGFLPNDIAISSDGFAYVAIGSARAVTVINLGIHAVQRSVPLSGEPRAVAVSADGRFTYAAIAGPTEGGVEVIDNRLGSSVAFIPVVGVPVDIAAGPDGARVYAVSPSGTELDPGGRTTIIDGVTHTAIASLRGESPYRVAVTPDGAFTYVAGASPNVVDVIDTRTNLVVGHIPAGMTPLGIAFSPDGDTVYVMNHDSSDVYVIDAAAGRVTATIVGGRLGSVAAHPDGSALYITRWRREYPEILTVDSDTGAVTASIPLGPSNYARLTIQPDGSALYFVHDPIVVIDTAANTVAGTILLPSPTADFATYVDAVAFAPDGVTAYAAAFVPSDGDGHPYEGALFRIDTSSHVATKIAGLGIGNRPGDVALTPDGRLAYVPLQVPVSSPHPPRVPQPPRERSGGLLVIDTMNGDVVDKIDVAARGRITIDPDGHFAYLTTRAHTVIAIDVDRNLISTSIRLDFLPYSLALTPDGSSLYVAGSSPTLAVIDTATKQVTASVTVGGMPAEVAIGRADVPFCPGDCDGDGSVTVSELVTGVRILMDAAPLAACRVVDGNRSGTVDVDEIVSAAQAVLSGC